VTGMSMTPALNSLITDSAPGMAALSTGHKSNNNQLGVYPDNTIDDAFDNPRVEYIGALMRRTRGEGFNVGIVTTADVTDATPAGNAIHTADRNDGQTIAARFFDERDENAVRVLLGGGRRQFLPRGVEGGARRDERPLLDEFVTAGFTPLSSASDVQGILDGAEV